MKNKKMDNENFPLFLLQFRIPYQQLYQTKLIPHYQNFIIMSQ